MFFLNREYFGLLINLDATTTLAPAIIGDVLKCATGRILLAL